MTLANRSNARIEFRLSSAEKKEIERAAKVQNQSLTEFATATLTGTARKVLAEHEQHEHVRLSNRDRDRFLEMLGADPSPNRAMQAAAKRHRR